LHLQHLLRRLILWGHWLLPPLWRLLSRWGLPHLWHRLHLLVRVHLQRHLENQSDLWHLSGHPHQLHLLFLSDRKILQTLWNR
jgi:hypothetical protein